MRVDEKRRTPFLTALLVLLLAGCSSGGAADDAEEPPQTPTTAGEGTSPAPPAGEGAALPATDAQAALTVTYNSAGGEFDAAVMGVAPGDVTAQWYSADGFYVVVYDGLDLDASGPMCPGNSIQVASGAFEFVSNAPTAGADCSGFPTLTDDPDVGPLGCDGVVSYRTAIPAGTEGNLFGTLERPVTGGVMGLTSVATTSAGVPEVDIDLLSC